METCEDFSLPNLVSRYLGLAVMSKKKLRRVFNLLIIAVVIQAVAILANALLVILSHPRLLPWKVGGGPEGKLSLLTSG